MIDRWGVALGAWVVALVATACAGTAFRCTADNECRDGQVCATDGVCRTACTGGDICGGPSASATPVASSSSEMRAGSSTAAAPSSLSVASSAASRVDSRASSGDSVGVTSMGASASSASSSASVAPSAASAASSAVGVSSSAGASSSAVVASSSVGAASSALSVGASSGPPRCPDGTLPERREYFRDADGDGWGDGAVSVTRECRPLGYVRNRGDCAPDDANAYPGAPETACTWPRDENCDGNPADGCAGCSALLAAGVTTRGTYVMAPAPGEPARPVGCLFDNGVAYTLVQRTTWDWTATQALRTDSATFAGVTVGTPSGAAPYRMEGRLWPAVNTQAGMRFEVYPRTSEGGGSRCGPITLASAAGPMTMDNGLPSLPAVTPLLTHTRLSTTSEDRDTYAAGNCVTSFGAIPWFYGGCCAVCPAFGGAYWEPGVSRPMLRQALISSLLGPCTGKPLVRDNIVSVVTDYYVGMDVMELYLR